MLQALSRSGRSTSLRIKVQKPGDPYSLQVAAMQKTVVLPACPAYPPPPPPPPPPGASHPVLCCLMHPLLDPLRQCNLASGLVNSIARVSLPVASRIPQNSLHALLSDVSSIAVSVVSSKGQDRTGHQRAASGASTSCHPASAVVLSERFCRADVMRSIALGSQVFA